MASRINQMEAVLQDSTPTPSQQLRGEQVGQASQPKGPREWKCYFCEKIGHLVLDCLQRRNEIAGRPPQRPKPTHTKQVTVGEIRNAESTGVDPLDLLYSSPEEETEVCLVERGR